MEQAQGSAGPAAPPPDAAAVLKLAIQKGHDWQHRMSKLHSMIAHDVLNPAESQYQVWGFHLLPTADMSKAQDHLLTMQQAIGHIGRLTDEMSKPGFLSEDKAHVEKTGHELAAAMAQARSEARAAANAAQTATMKVVNRDMAVADGAFAADKFIMDKAPEVMGDIVLAITKSEHAKSLVKNGATVALNAVAHASAHVQGINIDGAIDSLAKAGFDAAIEIIADLVPGAKGPVKKALGDMLKDILKDIAKKAPGKHGKELAEVCRTATNDGVTGALQKLAGEHPILKNSKLRSALITPVLKAVIGAEKALIEGKSASDGFKEGLQKGVVDVAFKHGSEKLVHGAKDHSDHAHSDNGDPDHAQPDHGHPTHGAAKPGHPAAAHAQHGESGHHPGAGASQAVKDAWLKEHLKIDMAAHNGAHAGH